MSSNDKDTEKDTSWIKVGSTVRATLPGQTTSKTNNVTGRATVATAIHHQDKNHSHTTTTVSLLYDDPAPRPLSSMGSSKFLLAPMLPHQEEVEVDEVDEASVNIRPLLPFEISPDQSSTLLEQALQYKLHGDEFYAQHHDVSLAISYYDASLILTGGTKDQDKKKVMVGSTVIAKLPKKSKQDNPVALEYICAEVDCVDDDDDTVDLSYFPRTKRLDNEDDDDDASMKECTVSSTAILLTLLPSTKSKDDDDDDDKTQMGRRLLLLQERILLNLARCLYKLGDVVYSQSNTHQHGNNDDTQLLENPYHYSSNAQTCWKSAVQLCDISMLMLSHHTHSQHQDQDDDDDDDDATMVHELTYKTKFVRCKCHVKLGHYTQATADAKSMLNHAAHSSSFKQRRRQAQKLWTEIQQGQLEKSKRDKKLAKEVCQWVHSITAKDGGEDGGKDGGGSGSGSGSGSTTKTRRAKKKKENTKSVKGMW